MNVLGIEGNVGSMLFPFLEEGHNIVGNYDSRGIVNEENFGINFPDAELYSSLDKLPTDNIDIIVSQPSCSKFSQLSRRAIEDYDSDNNVDLGYYIGKIRPKHFFIESKIDYIYEMPKVCGYKYQLDGNTQKGRNRLWVIATRDDIDWSFVPSEAYHNNTVASVIEDLPAEDIPQIDHNHVYKPFLKNSITKEYLTLDEAFAMLLRDGKLSYTAADGQTKHRINRKIANNITSTTITGGGTWFHWDKKYPLTLREKARIQGFPDLFSFKGLSNTNKDKAVGKSMPLEFTRYLVKLLDGKVVGKNTKMVPEPAKLTIFKRKFTK